MTGSLRWEGISRSLQSHHLLKRSPRINYSILLKTLSNRVLEPPRMTAPHLLQGTYSSCSLFSQGKRFSSEPVHADGFSSPPPTSVQRCAPRRLRPCFSHRQKRGWWACSSLHCSANLSGRLVQHLPFSSRWCSSPVSMTIQRWQ